MRPSARAVDRGTVPPLALGQTALIVAGITVGIAVQIFVGSLITSLQDDLTDTTVGSSPHVTLLPADGDTLAGDLAATAAEEPEVTAAIPVRTLSVIATSDDRAALRVTGGTADDLDAVYGLEERIVDGEYSLEDGEILVGIGFADDTGIAPGDDLAVVLPDGEPGEFTVAGLFDHGAAAANDRFAFLAAGSAAEALGQDEDEYSAIEIQVDDVFVSTEVAARLEGASDVEVVDWQDENEELLSGLSAQSGSSLRIQAFVLIAVALGIASTLASARSRRPARSESSRRWGCPTARPDGSSCCRRRSWGWPAWLPGSRSGTC